MWSTDFEITMIEMEESAGNIMKQQTHPYYSDSVDSFSSESFKAYPDLVTINESLHELATANGGGGGAESKQQQQDSQATKISPFAPTHGSSSNTFTISFGNPTSPQDEINQQFQFYGGIKDPDSVIPKDQETSLSEFLGSIDGITRFRSTRRNHRQAQEHVLAERKRREKLAERFISLSTLLPGLKKMDKASVLEDASNYIIQLQTRVKELEEETYISNVKGKEIVDLKRGSKQLMVCGRTQEDVASSDDACYLPAASSSSTCINPEIKARIYGSKILVRIYCIKSSSLVLKTLTEMERLHITIVAFSVLPFTTAHLITITAQMSAEIVITAKYLVKCLESALMDFP